jgi:DNA-binding NarL/FixJ family response regulator
MNPMRVLVVDDQVLFRDGLASLIATQPDMVVVGEASDGEEGVAKARALRPDLILMDIRMPKMTGLEATRLIHQDLPAARVVILTVSDADDDLFEAIKAGAFGYLLKNLKAAALFDRLRGAFQGEVALSPLLAARVLDEFAKRHQPESTGAEEGTSGLTERERTVLHLAIGGASNKEIAASLNIAESTVKRHMHNILEKLHLENRVQAAAYAVRKGLIEPGAQ